MKTILAVLALSCLAMPAFAQTVEQNGATDEYGVDTQRAQDTFLKYQMSMEAEAKCNHVSFSVDDLAAMNKAIADEMVSVSPNVSTGAARLLYLRRKAVSDMDDRISGHGCDGKYVKDMMQFYDERLAHAHGVATPPPYADTAAVQSGAASDDEGTAPLLMPTGDDGAVPPVPASSGDMITNEPARMPSADDAPLGQAPMLTPTMQPGSPTPLTPGN